MFGAKAPRQLSKHALIWAKVKLLYSRITLTRCTTFYFFFAIVACIVLCTLQGVAFADNTLAVDTLKPLLQNASINGIVILEKGRLQTCNSIPSQRGTNCVLQLTFGDKIDRSGLTKDNDNWKRHYPNSGNLSTPTESFSLTPNTCALSLYWLHDVVKDDLREDVVTLVFQIWLFSLALVTILNESLPHLGAALLGHVLNTAWAVYRLRSTFNLEDLYHTGIVPEACGGQDFIGNWWDLRIQHAIPIVAVNIIILSAFIYLSISLYKVYTSQSFSRVGASPEIHRIYKVILLFSVGLQVCAFFTVASLALWINKICHGAVSQLARHSNIYLVVFIISLVLQPPWLHFGWVCVRKECKIRFLCFCVICIFLAVLSTLMFFSPLYRYIVTSWPFFATITITAYILIAFTSILAIFCRSNFGKGLEHFLQVTEALEEVNFTPVSFFKDYDKDLEKGNGEKKTTTLSESPITLQLPGLLYQSTVKKDRGFSVYSDHNGNPIMLSFSPPLVSELGPRPSARHNKLSEASRKRSIYVNGHRCSKDDKPVGKRESRDKSSDSKTSLSKVGRAGRRQSIVFLTQGERSKPGLPATPRAGSPF